MIRFMPLPIVCLAIFLLTTLPLFSHAADEAAQTSYGVDLKGYYYSDDNAAMFDRRSSNLAFSVDISLAHRFNGLLAVDFAATGFANALDQGVDSGIGKYFEDAATGVFLNKANLQLNLADTTVTVGRNTLQTPLFQSLDWLLGPAAFDLISVENNALEHFDFFAAYVFGWRQFNGGNNWTNLSDISAGSNWMVHAGYSDKKLQANLWYYDVDIGEIASEGIYSYSQVYGDADYDFGPFRLYGQAVYTGWRESELDDSKLAGLMAVTSVAGFTFSAVYQYIRDSHVGYIEADSLYASAWGTFSGWSVGHNVRFEIDRQLFDVLTVTVNGAWYQYDQFEDSGHEFDLILAWQALEQMDVNLVFYNTDYSKELGGEVNALEIFATYSF